MLTLGQDIQFVSENQRIGWYEGEKQAKTSQYTHLPFFHQIPGNVRKKLTFMDEEQKDDLSELKIMNNC